MKVTRLAGALLVAVAALHLTAPSVRAAEQMRVILDWFVNPDHAPLIIAREKGFFRDVGLEVELIAPADPNDPPKLVAAKQASLAVSYQPQLHLQVEQELPVVRVGTLIATPLNSVVTLADGPVRSVADLKGRPAVVTFLYTTCEDTCPLVAQQIVGAMDRLGHDVPAVAIAVDPPRDTPARARRFLAEQRAAGRIRFLTGPERELRRLWRAFGIQRQSPRHEHSGYVVLLDREGRQRIGFPADRVTPDALASDLALLERQG